MLKIYQKVKQPALRSESDYALKNEIKNWKIEVWPIRTKGAKISLSSLVKFQSVIFNA